MTLPWRRTNTDPWDWEGGRVNSQRLPRFLSMTFPSSSSLFSPSRSLPREKSHDEEFRSPALSPLNRDLADHVRALTQEAGIIPVDLEGVLAFGVEVFVLSEGCAIDASLIAVVWQHSLRTGYLAALISLNQREGQRIIWQSFVGGVLHDIGMLIFLMQQPQIFTSAVNLAQSRGWDLQLVEQHMLGSTHAETGANFLARWDVDEVLLTTVACHDDPMKGPHGIFGPWTAVYAANLVEGGGMAQDGDGVIGGEGEAYLTRLGLWDDLPLWQGWMRSIHQLAL